MRDTEHGRLWQMRPDLNEHSATFGRAMKVFRRRGDQAARLDGASTISVPSRNVAPATIFGNWFSPFSLRQVFEAAITSLKTISLAVDGDSDPLVLTVL